MLSNRYYKLVLLFVTPSLVVYVVFMIYPALKAFYVSLFSWRGVSRQMTFIGLENYTKLFHDPIMWKALKHNAFFALAFPIAILLPSTLFALGLRRKIVGSNLYRVVFLLPNLMSVAVVAVLWGFLYEPRLGPINAGLRLIGLDFFARPWLGDPKVALPALVLPIAWINIGFYVVIIYAGLLDLPRDVYDAASIDGATNWEQFWYITVPLLWDIITIVTIFIIVGALNEFSLVLIMTNGGPSRSTELMATYMYKLFLSCKYGYGTAVGVVQFTLSFAVLVITKRLMNRKVVEY